MSITIPTNFPAWALRERPVANIHLNPKMHEDMDKQTSVWKALACQNSTPTRTRILNEMPTAEAPCHCMSEGSIRGARLPGPQATYNGDRRMDTPERLETRPVSPLLFCLLLGAVVVWSVADAPCVGFSSYNPAGPACFPRLWCCHVLIGCLPGVCSTLR